MRLRSRAIGLAGLFLLASALILPTGCARVDDETLSLLPPDRARELRTWSTNHAIVFDLRIHSMETCPFLTYLPARTFMQGQDWADWAWKFYAAKHREEGHCTCDAELAAPLTVSSEE